MDKWSEWETFEKRTQVVTGQVEISTDDIIPLIKEKLNLPGYAECSFDDWAALTFHYKYEEAMGTDVVLQR